MTLGAETIEIRRAELTSADRFGNFRRDWSNATSATVTGCSVQPFQATESTVDREFASTHMLLFAPWGTDLLATDRVVHNGQTYEVDGEPGQWRDDQGAGDHIEASLKRVTG